MPSVGDPIELGAAAAVMFGSQQHSHQQPLLAAAGKSWIGHTEAAAGSMGIIHALVGLRSQSAQALLNLTAVNPYLETALRPAGATAAAWSLPRQAAGLPCSAGAAGSSLSSKLGSGSVLATGISSFAFQVTSCICGCLLPKLQSTHGLIKGVVVYVGLMHNMCNFINPRSLLLRPCPGWASQPAMLIDATKQGC